MFTSRKLSHPLRTVSSFLQVPVALVICLMTVCLTASFPCDVYAGLVRTAPGGPSLIRLSWTGDLQTTMTVTWQDAADTERAWIEYTSGTTLDDVPAGDGQEHSRQLVREQEARLVEHSSLLSDGGTQWTAALTGLEPGTTYCYRINSVAAAPEKPGGHRYSDSGICSFTTREAAGNADSMTFAYFGDVQVNQEAEGEFTRWGQLAQAALERNPEICFGMMGGDIVESGISTEQFDMFFDAASPVFARIPLFATNGNHESNFLSGRPELYLDSFTLPENGPEGFKEEFYSFDAGPVHMIVLNSWVYSGEQKLTDEDYERIAAWIRRDLEDSRATWKIAVMHHPLYPVHSDRVADLVREHWAPLLQEGGVDLLLCGHQHVYCRSVPMTDGLTDEEHGITQVMGVSGEKFYSSANELNMERVIYGVSNYQILRATGNSLEIQCLDKDGQELDYAVLSAGSAGTGADRFTDVSGNDWFRNAVDYVVRRSFFNGVSETAFGPRQGMTRAMFATVLSRLAGVDPSAYTGQVFRDAPDGQWYSAGIAWAAEKGIVSGIGDGLFDPDGQVTREQMAVMLYRYAGFKEEPAGTAPDRLVSFTDRAAISPYAVEAMNWAVDRGILNGMGDGTIAPRKTATRAEVAQIVMNYDCINTEKNVMN